MSHHECFSFIFCYPAVDCQLWFFYKRGGLGKGVFFGGESVFWLTSPLKICAATHCSPGSHRGQRGMWILPLFVLRPATDGDFFCLGWREPLEHSVIDIFICRRLQPFLLAGSSFLQGMDNWVLWIQNSGVEPCSILNRVATSFISPFRGGF